MEYFLVGVALIAELILYKRKSVLANGFGPSAFEVMGFAVFGGFFIMIGMLGFALGVADIMPSFHGFVVLIVIYFYVLISVRLLSLATVSNDGCRFLKMSGVNVFEMIMVAFSIGLFPRKKPYSLFINSCQLFLVFLMVFFIKEIVCRR